MNLFVIITLTQEKSSWVVLVSAPCYKGVHYSWQKQTNKQENK